MKRIIFLIFILTPSLLFFAFKKNDTDRPLLPIEKIYIANGLVDAGGIIPSLKVNLIYSSENNFLKFSAYGNLDKCYLRPEAAVKLAAAAQKLKEMKPGCKIMVADAARPRRIQRQMWELVKGTKQQIYVANPAYGSMHNFGAAVDVTIIDKDGNQLDMGTPLHFFGELSQPFKEQVFLKSGQLTRQQVSNRKLLRDVMTAAGFYPIEIEWWHFNAFSKKETRNRFSIIE